MILARVTRHAIELRLELPNVSLHLLLALDQPIGLRAIDAAARRILAELVHVVRDAALIVRDLLRLLHGVVQIARRARVLVLVEQPAGFLEPVERGRALPHAAVVRAGRRASHRVRRFLQATRALGDLVVVRIVRVLAREALELASHLLRLVRELPLRSTTAAALLAGLPAHAVAQALVLLLQPARELFELLRGLVDLVVRLLLLRTAFDGLVLIAQLVRIELEQVCEIFGVRLLATAATTLLLAALNLVFVECRFRALQMLQGALLRRKRVGRVALQQLLFRRLHLLRGQSAALRR